MISMTNHGNYFLENTIVLITVRFRSERRAGEQRELQ